MTGSSQVGAWLVPEAFIVESTLGYREACIVSLCILVRKKCQYHTGHLSTAVDRGLKREHVRV